MFTYYHTCLDCGTFPVETKSIAEYVAAALKHGRTETDTPQMPCPSCEKLAPRDYTAGGMPYIKVQGGDRYQSKKYQNDAKKDWYKNEIEHTKNVINHTTGKKTKRPYSQMENTNPESLGFKPVSMEAAKARADAAKKMSEKIDDSRKSS
jgi:hypothetical protein